VCVYSTKGTGHDHRTRLQHIKQISVIPECGELDESWHGYAMLGEHFVTVLWAVVPWQIIWPHCPEADLTNALNPNSALFRGIDMPTTDLETKL
jgi:hypothetical protein